MKMSEKIDLLATALCEAQKEIEGAVKDGVNPVYQSAYPTLASVWAAVKGPFTKNGLSVLQAPGEGTANSATLTTLVMHTSGQWIYKEGSIPIVGRSADKPADAHSACGGITYLRKYGLASFAGVCPEDDDGNAACGKSKTSPIAEPQAKPAPKTTQPSATGDAISSAQASRFWGIANAAGKQVPMEFADVKQHVADWLPREFQIDKPEDIPKDQYEEIIDRLLELGGAEWAETERTKIAAQNKGYAKR